MAHKYTAYTNPAPLPTPRFLASNLKTYGDVLHHCSRLLELTCRDIAPSLTPQNSVAVTSKLCARCIVDNT